MKIFNRKITNIFITDMLTCFHIYRYILESLKNRIYNIQMADFTAFIYLLGAIIGSLYISGAFHIIEYGNIGVYKRGGALLDNWT